MNKFSVISGISGISENSEISGIKKLSEEVKKKDDVLTCTAGDLRDAYGAERLGSRVRDAISNALRGQGLDHYPHKLPSSQDALVRVYRQGSPVAEVIQAVLKPDEKLDQKLRKIAKNDCERILDRIRDLLDEDLDEEVTV